MKKIGILFVIISTLLSCSIRPEISAQKGVPQPVDEFRLVDRLTISAIGDIMVHGAQLKSAWNSENQCYNFEPVFSHVKDILSTADITIGNLETTLPGKEKLYSGYPRFGTPDAIVAALQGVGIDIVTTANNHTCDQGEQGLVRTIKVLDAYGILHVGTYRDREAYETRRILVAERNHIRIALLSYTYGVNDMPIPEGTYVNLIDQQQMAQDIGLARAKNPDFIIILMHFGTEYQRYPDESQIKTVAFLFNEGVDIVLGSHPHVLQPYELQSITDKYGDKRPRLVIYSLGNFVSNQRDRYRDGGIIFNFTLQKHRSTDKGTTLDITDVHYIPTWVYAHHTTEKQQFYVLSIPQYLKNDQLLQLPDNAYQKMAAFYKDTQLHLQTSQMQERKEIKPQLIKGNQ